MGRNLSFCVDVRRVFGHDSKDKTDEASSSSQRHRSKKKWRFGRSSKRTNTTPSPPVERNNSPSPSPVPLVPSPPVEIISPSPSPIPSQPSPPVEQRSRSPVPSPDKTKSPSPVPSPAPSPVRSPVPSPPPIRVTPIHITPFEEMVYEPVDQPVVNENVFGSIEPIAVNEVEVTQEEEIEEVWEDEEEGEVVPVVDVVSSPSRSKEDIAAIKIQSLFRGYLARRAVRALKALVRLKMLADGDSAKHQTATALRAMQALTRIQSQVRSRRIRMHEDNQSQAQLQLKHERDLEKLKLTEDWNNSVQSKEQIEASLLNRQEAAMRRERALAYAFSHQWKASSRSVPATFVLDPTNPQWGWSQFDRWIGAPRLSQTSIGNRESTNNTNPFTNTIKATRKSLGNKQNNPVMSPERPSSPAMSLSRMSVVSGVSVVSSPKKSSARNSHFSSTSSVVSAGGPSSRSYLQPTESARAKSRLVRASTTEGEKGEMTEEKKEKSLVKKRLSFSVADNKSGMSQGRGRRHVGPVKSSDVASVKSVSSLA